MKLVLRSSGMNPYSVDNIGDFVIHILSVIKVKEDAPGQSVCHLANF